MKEVWVLTLEKRVIEDFVEYDVLAITESESKARSILAKEIAYLKNELGYIENSHWQYDANPITTFICDVYGYKYAEIQLYRKEVTE